LTDLAEIREAVTRAHAPPRKLSLAELEERERLDTAGELRALGIPAVPSPEAGDIWVVVGKMGTGKSTWAKAQVATWPDSIRVICFDYCDEWSRLGRASKHVRLGPLTQRMTVDEICASPAVLDAPYLRLAVVPEGTRAERAEDFRDLLALLDVGGGDDRDCVLVVEEVWATAALCKDEYGTLATLGRHSGLAMVFVAQWASAIPHEVRRQARLIAAHTQTLPLDIDALAEVMGEEAAARVRHLPKGEAEIWREAEPKREKKIHAA
jgi:hypothetical protein